MKKLIPVLVILLVLNSCTKSFKDDLMLSANNSKSKKITLAETTQLDVTTTGESFGCWYNSKFLFNDIAGKKVKNSYIWCLQNQDPYVISSEPGVNGNMLLFGSNTEPFHNNPIGKSMDSYKAWIISAITEIGGSDPVSGQWSCEIDPLNPNQIIVTIYDNISGCGNVETQFPNIGNPAVGSLHTAIFVKFDLQ